MSHHEVFVGVTEIALPKETDDTVWDELSTVISLTNACSIEAWSEVRLTSAFKLIALLSSALLALNTLGWADLITGFAGYVARNTNFSGVLEGNHSEAILTYAIET